MDEQEDKRRLFHYVTHNLGIEILDKTSSLQEQMFQRFMRKRKIGTYQQLLGKLKESRELTREMINHLTIKETYFFRENHHIDAVMSFIVPEMLAAAGASGGEGATGATKNAANSIMGTTIMGTEVSSAAAANTANAGSTVSTVSKANTASTTNTVSTTSKASKASAVSTASKASKASKASAAEKPLHIVSAGCSTGAEAYSLAIALVDTFGEGIQERVRISGYDIDEQAIEKAELGIYAMNSFRGVSQHYIDNYFIPLEQRRFQLLPSIRSMVTFHKANLLHIDEFLSQNSVDIMFYRNVSIYFSEQRRKTIFSKLARSLRPEGFLITSSTETLSHDFGILQLVLLQDLFLFKKTAASTDSAFLVWKDGEFHSSKKEAKPLPPHGKSHGGSPPHGGQRSAWELNEGQRTETSHEKGQRSNLKLHGGQRTETSHEKGQRSNLKLHGGQRSAWELNEGQRSENRMTRMISETGFSRDILPAVLTLLKNGDIVPGKKRLEELSRNRTFSEAALPRYRLLNAAIAFSERKFGEALQIASELSEQDPLLVEPHILSALILRGKNSADAAVKEWRHALYLDDAYWYPALHLAELYKQQGQLPAAVQMYRRLLNILNKPEVKEYPLLFFIAPPQKNQLSELCRRSIQNLGGGDF